MKNNHPLVSILVPVYNVELYLRQCLDSLKKQSLTDIEIICVNDGSTDGSLDILNDYASTDNRIKIINKRNGGLQQNMKKQISLSVEQTAYQTIYEYLNGLPNHYHHLQTFTKKI